MHRTQFQLKKLSAAYLQMKNAFTEDNSTGAANAGEDLEAAFKNFDKSVLTQIKRKHLKMWKPMQ